MTIISVLADIIGIAAGLAGLYVGTKPFLNKGTKNERDAGPKDKSDKEEGGSEDHADPADRG